MKAAVYYQNGGPEVLKYEDVPDPECHPKGVVIRVEAVSIEGGDTLNRWHGALFSKPHVVGYQAGGEIVQVGSEVTDLKVGQKVTTVNAMGSHAALRSVPAPMTWVLPDELDLKLGACVPIAVGTADDCLFEFGHLKAGETVLVQAGASGVGVAAIQLAKRAGATVLATASSDERLERLTEGVPADRFDVTKVPLIRRTEQGRGLSKLQSAATSRGQAHESGGILRDR